MKYVWVKKIKLFLVFLMRFEPETLMSNLVSGGSCDILLDPRIWSACDVYVNMPILRRNAKLPE